MRGRLSPASGYLCLVCLLVLSAQPAARLCTIDLLTKVNTLISEAPQQKELGSRLYTPSSQDYTNCRGSTLKCFGEEIQVLLDEWETAGSFTRGGSRFKSSIEDLAVKLNLTEAGCLKCEHLKEETAEKFLNELNQTFEKINYDYNC